MQPWAEAYCWLATQRLSPRPQPDQSTAGSQTTNITAQPRELSRIDLIAVQPHTARDLYPDDLIGRSVVDAYELIFAKP